MTQLLNEPNGPPRVAANEPSAVLPVRHELKPRSGLPQETPRTLIMTERQRTDLERRAQAIVDPIRRLRYLRNSARRVSRRDALAAGRLGVHRRRVASLVLALALALAILPLRSEIPLRHTQSQRRPAVIVPHPVPGFPNVWPVEHNAEYDLYSNGLRIENGLEVSNQPRSYFLISRDSNTLGPNRTSPAGIVFHTTESDQAPFESQQKPSLKRIGKEVLLYTRNRRAYHFVIDRFGRVHRIVAESDTANHAGHSIWADSRWVYLDLNASFLGVAFEARMHGDEDPITDAQIRAARALTEVLRAKYNLPAENCVTHAQVSVNPSNMLVGWHTDWGSRFPFEEIGLPDNYEIPNPSLYYFGFQYDPVYMNSTNVELWKGLAMAEERVRESAAGHGLTIAAYRGTLQQKYQDAQAALRHRTAAEENEYEQN